MYLPPFWLQPHNQSISGCDGLLSCHLTDPDCLWPKRSVQSSGRYKSDQPSHSLTKQSLFKSRPLLREPGVFWGACLRDTKVPSSRWSLPKMNHVALCVAIQLGRRRDIRYVPVELQSGASNRGDIFGGAREGGQTALSRCGCLRTLIYYYPVLYYFTFLFPEPFDVYTSNCQWHFYFSTNLFEYFFLCHFIDFFSLFLIVQVNFSVQHSTSSVHISHTPRFIP